MPNTSSYSYTYDPELGIATATDTLSGISVSTLLQRPGFKQPSINAYLGARYSRSANSISEIAQEVYDNNTDAAGKLENIFHGYGHASVAGMAHLFVCIENVPVVTAMRFFYLCPCQDGQERSTRYQNFQRASYPTNLPDKLPESLRSKYHVLMKDAVDTYTSVIPTTQEYLSDYFEITEDKKEVAALKSRTLDCARHLLPIGLDTSFGAVQSAREWSRYISLMRGSNQQVERTLGELLYTLLVGSPELEELGYIPEADGLIRHADPNTHSDELTQVLIKLALNLVGSHQGCKDTNADGMPSAVVELVRHIVSLIRPHYPINTLEAKVLSEQFGVLHTLTDQYHLLGNVGQSGAICLNGETDLGSLKDLNRHRSLEKFIPLLDNNVNFAGSISYSLAEYVHNPGLTDLFQTYDKYLNNYLKSVENWIENASRFLDSNELLEWGRYLLPHATKSEYFFYGSIEDFIYTIRTRIRPGGHINYRKLVEDWATQLAWSEPFFKGLLNQLSLCDSTSREQFVDRS